MSYILDALRRAEAERARERGKVPSLHDPAPAGMPTPTAAQRERGPGAWIAGGAVVLVLAIVVGAWMWFDRGEPVTTVASVGPATTADRASVAVAPAVVTPAPAAMPAPATLQLPTPSSTTSLPSTTSPSNPPFIPAPSQPVAPRELSAVPAMPRGDAAPRTPTAVAAPAVEAKRILDAAELPEDVRRALPPMTFGGAMYSDTPSARLLIINGQVLHEGDPVSKELVLEQIRLKTAVLAFRGYRYLVSY